MKAKIFSVILMTLLLSAVFINTYVIDKEILNLSNSLERTTIDEKDIEGSLAEAKAVYDSYKKRETFLSLTVNHDDLTSIEDNFAEMIGNLSVKDADAARVSKNRLLCSLEHLRRLSGINFDAII